MPRRSKKQRWNPGFEINTRKNNANNFWYTNTYNYPKYSQAFVDQHSSHYYNNFVPDNYNYSTYDGNQTHDNMDEVNTGPYHDNFRPGNHNYSPYDGNRTTNDNIDNFAPLNRHYSNYDDNHSTNDNIDEELTQNTGEEKKVITRQQLFEDTSSYHSRSDSNRSNGNNTSKTDTASWTDKFWQKHNDAGPSKAFGKSQSTNKEVPRNNQNKLERRLNQMLAKPAEMSKGKSLLEKMGWQGGGLGRSGDGIVEPIVPKATYASKTIGLGHTGEKTNMKKIKKHDLKKMIANNISGKAEETKKSKQNFPPSLQTTLKRNFVTNVLLKILEFVKNDREIELFFETNLGRKERKVIHQWVQQIRENEYLEQFENCSPVNLDIIKDIWIHNAYELLTESEGERTDRQLCLYKESPEHIYLILPSDLREEEIVNETIAMKTKENKKIGKALKKVNSNEHKQKNSGKKAKTKNNNQNSSNKANDKVVVTNISANDRKNDTINTINEEQEYKIINNHQNHCENNDIVIDISDDETDNVKEFNSCKETKVDNHEIVQCKDFNQENNKPETNNDKQIIKSTNNDQNHCDNNQIIIDISDDEQKEIDKTDCTTELNCHKESKPDNHETDLCNNDQINYENNTLVMDTTDDQQKEIDKTSNNKTDYIKQLNFHNETKLDNHEIVCDKDFNREVDKLNTNIRTDDIKHVNFHKETKLDDYNDNNWKVSKPETKSNDRTDYIKPLNFHKETKLDDYNDSNWKVAKPETNSKDRTDYIKQLNFHNETKLDNHEIECDKDFNKERRRTNDRTDVIKHLNFHKEAKLDDYKDNNWNVAKPETKSNDRTDYIKQLNYHKQTELDDSKRDFYQEINKPETVIRKLVKYFKEFADDVNCTELRFLGPFNDEEVENMNLFFDICLGRDTCEHEEKFELLSVFNNDLLMFDVQEDYNGRLLVVKSERSDVIQTSFQDNCL